MQEKTGKSVLAAIPDLLFGSKVSGTAAQLGIPVRFAGTRQALLDGARDRPALIVVDLEAAAVDPLGVVGELRSLAPSAGTRLVAFASHVRQAALRQAREAGYDDVLTRGALSAGLPALLAPLQAASSADGVRSQPD
ncbi:MAG: hypothetical protein OXD30_07800 [Bryobacterales bacterium]|nr:hypothetical protein [Bryobacterales bacterium]